jgi:hypothetical protein
MAISPRALAKAQRLHDRKCTSNQLGTDRHRSIGEQEARVTKSDVDGSNWQNITTLNNKAGGCEGTIISNCRATNAGYDDVQITNVRSRNSGKLLSRGKSVRRHLCRDWRSQSDGQK